ncbi:MAG: DUF4139 domain-containing protein [Planctomycetota bacterium]|jgi:hypothetical protein
MKNTGPLAVILFLALAGTAHADVDLVVLPQRDSVQVTVYNSADLTLVREVRTLTLREGDNKLCFAWSGTLIDPTSVAVRAPKHGDRVELVNASYPPRVGGKAVWTVRSEVAGPVPVEITYFISGVSWRAFYMGTLSRDETSLKIDGYVRVTNNSGDDFEEAQTRLVVGKVNLLDRIANLARRIAPYGKPGEGPPSSEASSGPALRVRRAREMRKAAARFGKAPVAEKKIVKEGLSEYFLYTIEGTETIENRWSKRLPSFHAEDVKVVNLFKYDEQRWGRAVRRFLQFKNDKAHKLGETPLPDGVFKIYRTADGEGLLSFEGTSRTKYIPVDQKCDLDLGNARKVLVEPKLMEQRFVNHTFNRWGNVDGWDEVQTWRVEVKNRRKTATKVEITRNFRHQYIRLKNAGDFGEYKKDDLDTVKYTLTLKPGEEKTFTYTLRLLEGKRRQIR